MVRDDGRCPFQQPQPTCGGPVDGAANSREAALGHPGGSAREAAQERGGGVQERPDGGVQDQVKVCEPGDVVPRQLAARRRRAAHRCRSRRV